MRKIEGKVALITGCNRGIGLAIMERFVQEGADIVACCRTFTPETLACYEKMRSQYGAKIYPVTVDLSEEESIKTAMKEVRELQVPIDILVNNAGVAAGGFMLMTSMAELKRVFQVNYFAQVQITQHVAKMMMRRKQGSIIMMSSVLGEERLSGGTAYGASKAAVMLFTKTVAKELGAYNIRINAIAPNLVDTEMGHQMEQKSYEKMIADTALGRIATPDDISSMALFLAGEESSYITGQTIRVDGGLCVKTY